MNYQNYNDYELIYMIRENDDSSVDILFQKYQLILHHMAREYYEKFSHYGYDYEDFYQEAVIAFYKSLQAYDEEKNSLFYSFATLCVRRNLLSFCRNISMNHKNIANSYVADIDECVVEDPESNPNMLFKCQDLQDICRSVIFQFPSLEASSILELRINGFSYREIASLLDISCSSVEFRSRKIRSILRGEIEKYYAK